MTFLSQTQFSQVAGYDQEEFWRLDVKLSVTGKDIERHYSCISLLLDQLWQLPVVEQGVMIIGTEWSDDDDFVVINFSATPDLLAEQHRFLEDLFSNSGKFGKFNLAAKQHGSWGCKKSRSFEKAVESVEAVESDSGSFSYFLSFSQQRELWQDFHDRLFFVTSLPLAFFLLDSEVLGVISRSKSLPTVIQIAPFYLFFFELGSSLLPCGSSSQVLFGSPKFWRIWLRAGEAFGTGHHPTTSLCIGALFRLSLVAKSGAKPWGGNFKILDLGTGSGVLSMAAYYLFSYRRVSSRLTVMASDNDAKALAVAETCLVRNNLQNSISLLLSDGLAHSLFHRIANGQVEKFHLIIANILYQPLLEMSTGLSKVMARGGFLILSGLTRVQVKFIVNCYTKLGFCVFGTQFSGDWGVVTFRFRR